MLVLFTASSLSCWLFKPKKESPCIFFSIFLLITYFLCLFCHFLKWNCYFGNVEKTGKHRRVFAEKQNGFTGKSSERGTQQSRIYITQHFDCIRGCVLIYVYYYYYKNIFSISFICKAWFKQHFKLFKFNFTWSIPVDFSNQSNNVDRHLSIQYKSGMLSNAKRTFMHDCKVTKITSNSSLTILMSNYASTDPDVSAFPPIATNASMRSWSSFPTLVYFCL